MRLVLSFIVFFSVLQVRGQGTPRTLETMAQLIATDPVKFATSGKLVYLVGGYRTNGDWGAPREIHWDSDGAATTNLGCVWSTITTNGQWVAKDCESGEIDVRKFGAVGDGVTDDTTAIQAAIDWAAQQLVVVPSLTYSNAFGATIKFPDNKIFLHDTLILKRGVRLVGGSPADKSHPNDTSLPRLLLKAGATGPSLLATIYTNHLGNWEGPGGITLQGLVIDGNFDQQDTNNFGLHGLLIDGGATAYAKQWNIDGCCFVNHVGYSIYAFRALGASTIRNCYLGNGLFTTVVADLKVTQCDITGRTRGLQSASRLNAQPFPALWLADYTVYNSWSDVFVYCGPTNNAGQPNSLRTWQITGYDSGTDVITVSSTNGMHEGMPLVWRTTGTYPGGLNSNFTYYPTFVSANTLKLSRIALWGQNPRQYDDITNGIPTDDVLQFGEAAAAYMNGDLTTTGNTFSNLRIQDGDDKLLLIDGASMNLFANLILSASYSGGTYLTIRGSAYDNKFVGGAANALYPLVGIAPATLVHLYNGTTGNKGLGFFAVGGLTNNVLNESRTQPGNYWDNTMPWLDQRIGNASVLRFIDSDTDRTNNIVWDSWNIYFKRDDSTDVGNTADMLFAPSSTSIRLELHGDQSPTQLYQYAYGDASNFGRLDFTTTGGSRATNTATRAGNLGALFFGGHDGIAQTSARASIIVNAPSLWAETNNPTEVSFEVTPTNSTNRYETLRILNNGDLVHSNTAPVLTAKAGNGASGFRLNVLGGSASLFRLQSNSVTVLDVTPTGAPRLNTLANLTGGNASNFFRGDGVFTNIVPIAPTNNGAYVLFVTNGVASWIAHP